MQGELGWGEHREATVGTVAGVLERDPLVRCGHGHSAAATHDAGVADTIRQRCLTALPRARRRRLRGDACTACGAEMTMPVRRTERGVTVDGVADLPALTLRFDLPMSRCPACAFDQVPSRSQADLHAVVTALSAPSRE
jgi:hypothetical protein